MGLGVRVTSFLFKENIICYAVLQNSRVRFFSLCEGGGFEGIFTFISIDVNYHILIC